MDSQESVAASSEAMENVERGFGDDRPKNTPTPVSGKGQSCFVVDPAESTEPHQGDPTPVDVPTIASSEGMRSLTGWARTDNIHLHEPSEDFIREVCDVIAPLDDEHSSELRSQIRHHLLSGRDHFNGAFTRYTGLVAYEAVPAPE